MSNTDVLPHTASPTRESVLALCEEGLATARAEIDAAMAAEGRTEQTFDETCRLFRLQQAGPHKAYSSATSVSSDEGPEDIVSDSGDEATGASKVPHKRWVIRSPVVNWAENRRAQMSQCFSVFCEEGFMYWDEVQAADNRVMKCLLHVVTHEDHWAFKGYMASPAFWACVFVMQSYSLRPEGYEVRHKSQEVLDHAKEAWTLDNMHKNLAGDKSKTFKDRVQSDEYMTCVGGGGKGLSRAVTRGKLKLRKLGVHDLGKTDKIRIKKMATLIELMEKAGVERPHQRICDMQPPTTVKLKMSNSAREKAMARIEADWDATGNARSNSFLESRAAMLGTRCAVKPKRPASPIKAYWHPENRDDDSNVVNLGDGTFANKSKAAVHADAEGESASFRPVELPSDDEEDKRVGIDDAASRIIATAKAKSAQDAIVEPATVAKAAGSAEPRAHSPIRMPPLDVSAAPDHEARKAAKRARKEAAAASSRSASPLPASAPMEVDPEVQAMEAAMAEMAAKLAAAKQAAAAKQVAAAAEAARQSADSDSSELSSDEEPDEGGAAAEAANAALSDGESSEDDLAFINANQQEAACSRTHDQAVEEAEEDAKNTAFKIKQLERSEKARAHQKAINEGRTNVALSKEELRLLEWRESLDPDLLEHGIIQKIRKKRVTPFHIQMRRRREEAEKQKRREDRRALKDARAEIKHLQMLERAENKEEVRKRIEQEIAAKAERRRKKDAERFVRAKKHLKDSVDKLIADAKAKKERKQKEAQERLEKAQKYGRNTIVHFGHEGSEQNMKFTMFIAPPKPEKPVVAPALPKRNGYGVCELSWSQHERLDKYGVATPVEQADPYKRVKLDIEPTSNGIRSTRGASAVKKREEAELKRAREEKGDEAGPAKQARV